MLWVILRKEDAFDHLIPIYSGSKLQMRGKDIGAAVHVFFYIKKCLQENEPQKRQNLKKVLKSPA